MPTKMELAKPTNSIGVKNNLQIEIAQFLHVVSRGELLVWLDKHCDMVRKILTIDKKLYPECELMFFCHWDGDGTLHDDKKIVPFLASLVILLETFNETIDIWQIVEQLLVTKHRRLSRLPPL